jgi:hypothetical protein
MSHQNTQLTVRFGVMSSTYFYYHYANHTRCINRYTHTSTSILLPPLKFLIKKAIKWVIRDPQVKLMCVGSIVIKWRANAATQFVPMVEK